MQTQAPGYQPKKKVAGVKQGFKQVKTGGKKQTTNSRSKLMKDRNRKSSPYSKNRNGVKTTQVAKGYKSMSLDSTVKNQQVASNNLPGFNFPLGPPNASF